MFLPQHHEVGYTQSLSYLVQLLSQQRTPHTHQLKIHQQPGNLKSEKGFYQYLVCNLKSDHLLVRLFEIHGS